MAARGEESKIKAARKKTARKTQGKLQSLGVSKRTAENRAWDQTTTARSARQTGTAGGRSKVSKRTPATKGSTRKTKNTGKARR